MKQLTTEEKRGLVSEREWWYHSIDLGDNVVTPGQGGPGKLSFIHIPESLEGKTVLDVGAADGFFSFECEKRGATKVIAVDDDHWTGHFPIHGQWRKPAIGNFQYAKRILNSDVQAKLCSVYKITPEKFGTFDVVLFLGVIYHLLHPALAIEKLAAVTDELLILETGFSDDNDGGNVPTLIQPVEHVSYDHSNWSLVNQAWITSMLKLYGFREVEDRSHEGALEYHRWVFHAKK